MISKLKNPLLIFAILCLVVAGIFECIQRVDNKKYDMKVTAVVKSVARKYDSDDDEYKYKADCEYVVRDVTYVYETGWSSSPYNENDEIVISVNSDNPGKVNLHRYRVAAVAFLFFAVGVFFMYIKAKKDW
ncbi:MAG: DUF3592 domain-containing protein [Eubacterium sp.]|nr:DUF3592 domain-containing protein [Eubacterium sp.]